MSVVHLFVGMLTAFVIFSIPTIAIWHFTSKMYHEANQQGLNPFLPAIMGALTGLFVGIGIVASWLSIVGFAGFPGRYYACYFSYGNMDKCRQTYSNNSEMARDFEESMKRGDENLPRSEGEVPPWLRN